MSDRSNEKLRIQKRTFTVLALSFSFVVCAIGYFLFVNDSPQPSFEYSQKNVADLPGDKISPQEMWMTRMENESQLRDKKLTYLESLVLETKKQEAEKEKENLQLKSEISKLKRELQETKLKASEIHKGDHEIAFNEPIFHSVRSVGEVKVIRPCLTEVISCEPKDRVLHVDKVIPAGTSVKALLVSSVDATCGVNSASDPQPVKLRILDDGHLPKGVKAKLKGGIIIASGYGDLSSERVYMRLERLTKVKPNGEFIETEVTGYVSGEDGKYGVRGCVIDKSSKIIGNAAISGIFSGASQYLQAVIRSKYCGYGAYGGCAPCAPYDSCGGCAPCYPYGSDVAKEGAAYGACTGFDMLTNYYIQRAEQVRPVIQVTAGRIVDITFTHNAEFGDLYTHERVRKIREVSRSS